VVGLVCGKRGVVGVAATDASLTQCRWMCAAAAARKRLGFTLTLTIIDAMPATRVDATLACRWCLRRA
jgi:hypothetical protein